MEEVWKDLSLTTPSLSLLPLEPTTTTSTTTTHMIINSSTTTSTTTSSSFPLTCQDFLSAAGAPPLPTSAQPFGSPDNSDLKFALDKGLTSASSISAEDSVDRRRNRIMKNRESAARSRARKQAYTKQLQLEVDNLKRENRRLREQYEELLKEMKAQAPAVAAARNKNVLQRTLSAPY